MGNLEYEIQKSSRASDIEEVAKSAESRRDFYGAAELYRIAAKLYEEGGALSEGARCRTIADLNDD